MSNVCIRTTFLLLSIRQSAPLCGVFHLLGRTCQQTPRPVYTVVYEKRKAMETCLLQVGDINYEDAYG